MLTIAIDGPSGAGKSSVAAELSKRLGILHFNTGALYRAIGLFALKKEINYKDETEFNSRLDELNIEIDFKEGKQVTILNGEDVSNQLYSTLLDEVCSTTAQYESARAKVLDLQRSVAKTHSLVMEGRDITWHVLPNADFKFYVTASAEVRADRRIKDKHHTAKNLSYEEVLKDIIERDNKDINRKLYPLKIVEDAIVVNTDNLTFEEVVESIIKIIKGE